MMKKTIFRLCFLLTILSTLWCCRNEEFSTEDSSRQRSYNSSARFASKSFWKEDEVYIHKVQQVFMKVANMEHVKNRYGDMYWDYAMTFGQFGESYLLVPVVKDNRVVLLMEAVREGNKVYFFEKEDKGKIDFFQAVIFSKITDYGEKTDSQNSTLSRNTPVFQCNTRWITIGCTDKEPNCIPYTTSETICKWIPGTTPKTFDPIGMDDGGGGGNGYEYPDPPEEKSPCTDTKNMLTSASFQNKVKKLEEKSQSKGEVAFLHYKDNSLSDTIQGGEHNVDVSAYSNYNGLYHNHTPTGIKMFSVGDIVTLYKIIMTQMTPQTIQDAFIGFVAGESCNCPPDNYIYHNYILRFNGNMSQVGSIANLSEEEIKNLTIYYGKRYMELKLIPGNLTSNNFSADLNVKALEKLFYETLIKMNINASDIILQKVEKSGTINNVNLNTDGTTDYIKCS